MNMKYFLRLLTICCALSLTTMANAELLPYPIDTINGQAVYKYRVPHSIGIYRISVNFEVTQQEIIEWNPQLKERGLHYDEVILIPVKQVAEPTPEPVVAVEVVDTPAVVEVDTMPVVVNDSVPVEETDTTPRTKIALLLPLQAESVRRDANMDRFMDFYEGCLIALYDLQYADKYELHVFDIGKTDMEVKRLIADSVLHKMNAILGPAYPNQVEPIARLAKEDSILTLIPFTDRVPDVQHNPFLLQFNPTAQRDAQVIAEFLETNKEAVNCVFVESPEVIEEISALQAEVKRRGISQTKVSMHQILADSLFLSLKDSVENILFFPSDKYSNLQIFLPHIKIGAAGQRVTLYSRYLWQKEDIALPQIFTSIFATDGEVDLTHYDAIYERYFKHAHTAVNPRYDLLGYDLMRQLVATIKGKEYYGLQSDIRFEQVGENGGWVNTHVKVVRK